MFRLTAHLLPLLEARRDSEKLREIRRASQRLARRMSDIEIPCSAFRSYRVVLRTSSCSAIHSSGYIAAFRRSHRCALAREYSLSRIASTYSSRVGYSLPLPGG